MYIDPEGLSSASVAAKSGMTILKVGARNHPVIRAANCIYYGAAVATILATRPDFIPQIFEDTVFNENASNNEDDDKKLTPEEKKHILDGDENGGGHRHASDNDKSKFPNKSDDEVIQDIEDVLNDPNSVDVPARDGATRKKGTSKSGVPIDIIIASDGEVLTAYPDWKRKN